MPEHLQTARPAPHLTQRREEAILRETKPPGARSRANVSTGVYFPRVVPVLFLVPRDELRRLQELGLCAVDETDRIGVLGRLSNVDAMRVVIVTGDGFADVANQLSRLVSAYAQAVFVSLERYQRARTRRELIDLAIGSLVPPAKLPLNGESNHG